MNSKDSNIKFIADVMLGKLAKWLRILGFDVFYQNNIEDSKIIEISERENRIILSRDKKLISLAVKNSLECVYIESDFVNQQLRQIFNIFKPNPINILTRCIKCNNLLKDVEKDEIEALVPNFIYNTHSKFSICRKCKKVYWKGSHINKIEDVIKKLLSSK